MFWFKALKNGILIQQKIESNSERDVVDYLKRNGYIPINIREIKPLFPELMALFDRVSFGDVVDFTRQLAIMLNAGLTLIDSFSILQKQITKPHLLLMVKNIYKEILGGSTFSKALQRYPSHFSNLYISLVKSGEASGKLSEILLRLADNLEKQRDFQAKIKGALIYPIIVVIGMIGVMFVMVTFVVPKLLNLYKDFNVELPISTQILILISNFSTQFWPFIFLAIFGSVIFMKKYLSTKVGKLHFDTITLKLPVFGKIISISALVDTTRTLSILIGSGVSILESLSIIIDTTGNIVYQNAFKHIYKQVEKGFALGTAFENEKLFPPILIQMTTVGEQTGHLDDTLLRISKYFEMESEMAVKTMTTLIEPLILVFLGLGVGFLVLAVITPIYNLTSSIK